MKKIRGITFIFLLYIISSAAVSLCGAEHSHEFAELYTVKPTCTEKGYTVFSCECGASCEGEIENPLGHNYSKERVYYKKADCTEKGEAGRYCQRCYSKTDIIYYDKTLHKPVERTDKATVKRNGEIRRECSVCKKLYSSKTISKIASVCLDKKTYTYDGKVKKPSVTVKDAKGRVLSENKDYTVVYQKGRKKTGRYSVKITFKGNYEGEKTLYFKIRPTAVKNVTAAPSFSSVCLAWDKSKGAEGYEIYLKSDKTKLIKDTAKLQYTVKKISGKKLKSGNDYTFIIKSYKKAGDTKIYSAEKKIKISTRPQKSRIKKLSSSSGKTTVRAVKQNCHGYEFLLGTNKSFSNALTFRTKGKDNCSYSFRNLVKGKTYFVKVRAYVNSGGEKYVGYYSEVKIFKG